jgi:hypothetical protein
LQHAGSTWQRDRGWSQTGQVIRKRKLGKRSAGRMAAKKRIEAG